MSATDARPCTVVILQPGYLPWLGFFDLLDQAAHFVFYDDVQYTKNDWRNRNRIKTPQGPQWLTVPVLHTGHFGQSIREARLDPTARWAHKHLQAFRTNYAQAPYFEPTMALLESVLAVKYDRLLDLNLALVRALNARLGLAREIHFASEMGIAGGQTERLVGICRSLGATEYLSGNAAREYLEEDRFREAGIALRFHNYDHPVYAQLWGPFISHLSVLDLIANHGPDSLGILTRRRAAIPGTSGSAQR